MRTTSSIFMNLMSRDIFITRRSKQNAVLAAPEYYNNNERTTTTTTTTTHCSPYLSYIKVGKRVLLRQYVHIYIYTLLYGKT